MPRFFVDGAASGSGLCITGDDARHIGLSLRMKTGDPLTVCDGTGREFSCLIRSIGRDRVELDVTGISESRAEPPVVITLYQCFLKGDKADELIRGCVELGASEICFVHSRNAVSRPDPDSALKKTARWQKIAAEASKQCGRGAIPRVLPPVGFSEAAEALSRAECGFACWEMERALTLKAFLDRPAPSRCSFLIGPEGGLAASETDILSSLGVPCVGLGNRILRAQTAPLAVLSSLLYAWEL